MEKGRYSIEIHLDYIDNIMKLDFINKVRQYGCQNLFYLVDHLTNERIFFKGLGIFDVSAGTRFSLDHKFIESDVEPFYGSFRRHRSVDYIFSLFEENDSSIFKEINVYINREYFMEEISQQKLYSYYYMSGTESVIPKLETASLLFKTKLNYKDYDPTNDQACSVAFKFYEPANIIKNEKAISESFLYKCTLDVYRKYKDRFVFMDSGTKAYLLFSKFANFTKSEINHLKNIGGNYAFDQENLRYLVKSSYLNMNFGDYLVDQLNESKCSSYKKLNSFCNRIIYTSNVNDRLADDIKSTYEFNKWFTGTLEPKVAENFIKVINRNKDKKIFHLLVLFRSMFSDRIEWDKLDSDIIDELFPEGFIEGKYRLGNVKDEKEIIELSENKLLEPLIPYYFESYQRIYQLMSVVKFLDIATDAEFNFYKGKLVKVFESHIRTSAEFSAKQSCTIKTFAEVLSESNETTRERMKEVFKEVQLIIRKNGTKLNYIRLANFISLFELDDYFDTKTMGSGFRKVLFESKLK